jgi:mono/diheme cytochrome c family protein
MRILRLEVAVATAMMLLGASSLSYGQSQFGLGRPATEAEIAAWNLDIDPDGKNLPAGQGSVKQGKEVYEAQCGACHGEKGEGGIGDRLVGGMGTLATSQPIKTVGSFWPYTTTLFDYIRRAMPINAPQSLSNNEVYAVTAYVLYLNGLIADSASLDAKSLTAIKMPNRDGFIPDPRPDVHNKGCMINC